MPEKQELLKEFSNLCTYVESLRNIKPEKWIAPIAEGKWSIRDIVAHMMLWDQHFLEEAIQKLAQQAPLTLKHLDFDDFNSNAVEFAKTKSKDEIIDLTIRYRTEIINHLSSLSDEAFTAEHLDGDGQPFTAQQYVLDFLWHDNHHVKQMVEFLGLSE